MPWEKQFDVEESLERAKELFWLQGFEATSMQELLTVMKINRGSFYDTFKSKQDLYLKVLKRYDEQSRDEMFKVIRQIKSPRDAILALFEKAIELAVSNNGHFGCFIANSVAEMAPHNEDARKVCNEALTATQKLIKNLVEEGQETGDIRTDADSEELASALFSLLLGVKLLARSKPEKSMLEASKKQAEFLLS